MNTTIKSVACIIISSLCLTGCAGLAYQHMNDPTRDTWQKPQAVLTKLAIMPGSKVADLGAGGGYFTQYLSGAVGTQGKVYAVDIDDTALDIIKAEISTRGLSNVLPIRAKANDAKLPEPVDLVFSSDTYHHIQDRVTYFRSLQRYLKPDGRVAILDFHPRGFFSGLLGHGTAKEVVRHEMEAAGYRLMADYDVVKRQHFQVFTQRKHDLQMGSSSLDEV
ncbi:MAG: class I SAM-dependent methyltransferase [Methyloglobulus sp.]|nr:class I SAM-dependent methyltransferase [Methyloglobulus sp.]